MKKLENKQVIEYLSNIIINYFKKKDINKIDVHTLKKDLETLYFQLIKISNG